MQVREDVDWQGRTRKWYAGAEGVTSASNLLQLYQLEVMISLSLSSPSVKFSCSYSHMHSTLVS